MREPTNEGHVVTVSWATTEPPIERETFKVGVAMVPLGKTEATMSFATIEVVEDGGRRILLPTSEIVGRCLLVMAHELREARVRLRHVAKEFEIPRAACDKCKSFGDYDGTGVRSFVNCGTWLRNDGGCPAEAIVRVLLGERGPAPIQVEAAQAGGDKK